MATYRCNLGCKMCFQREWRKRQRSHAELDFDELVRVIHQAPRYTLLTWTGGEPFVRSDMVEILRYAARRNPCNILTNGTLLGDEEIGVLVDHGVRLVGVSIDGIGDRHDEIRGKSGCFRKTVQAVQRLQQYKAERKTRFPLVDIKTVVLPDNLGELQEIFELAAQLQADFFTVSLTFGGLQFSPEGMEHLGDALEYPEVPPGMDSSLLISQLQKVLGRRSGVRVRIYPNVHPKHLTDYYRDRFEPKRYQPCKIPWSHLWLSPTGQVFPCLSYEVGNVRTQRLGRILNSRRFREFRKTIKNFGVVPACAGCCYLEQRQSRE